MRGHKILYLCRNQIIVLGRMKENYTKLQQQYDKLTALDCIRK